MPQSKYYSLANAATGAANPDEITVTEVTEDGGCDIHGCLKHTPHAHTYISWSGNGYTRRNTWISADEGSLVDLEEKR